MSEKVATVQGQSPGFFSVSYKCIDEHGTEAFLKASDLSKVLSSDPSDMMNVLAEATQAHKFERDVLELCRGNRMDRVVTALDFGNDNIVYNGVSEFLFFLVFELAEGDLRKRITQRHEIDLLWIISALHEYAVAVSQMHNGQVYHNDIKPANALTFSDGARKIADLGRATTPLMGASHDRNQCVGDMRFAPPEQLYALHTPTLPHERFRFQQAGDLFNLGSLAHYLLTGVNVSPEIISRLRSEHRPPFVGGGWTDDVALVIPYWRSHLGDMLQELQVTASELNEPIIIEETSFLVSLISELCEPDMRLRGFPPLVGKVNQCDLSRYISRLDLSRSRLLVRGKHAK